VVPDRELDDAVVVGRLPVAELDVALAPGHRDHPRPGDVEADVAAVGDEDLVAGLAAPAVVGGQAVGPLLEPASVHRAPELSAVARSLPWRACVGRPCPDL